MISVCFAFPKRNVKRDPFGFGSSFPPANVVGVIGKVAWIHHAPLKEDVKLSQHVEIVEFLGSIQQGRRSRVQLMIDDKYFDEDWYGDDDDNDAYYYYHY